MAHYLLTEVMCINGNCSRIHITQGSNCTNHGFYLFYSFGKEVLCEALQDLHYSGPTIIQLLLSEKVTQDQYMASIWAISGDSVAIRGKVISKNSGL